MFPGLPKLFPSFPKMFPGFPKLFPRKRRGKQRKTLFIESLIPSHHWNYKMDKNSWSLIRETGKQYQETRKQFRKPGNNLRKPGNNFGKSSTILGNKEISVDWRWPFSWISGHFWIEIPYSAAMVHVTICPRVNIHQKINCPFKLD